MSRHTVYPSHFFIPRRLACVHAWCVYVCAYAQCTPREQRRVLRPELSRSHGSSSGSGGDIPTYLPISLAARACVSQATLRILLLSLLPRVARRRSSSFTSFDTVSRTLTRTTRAATSSRAFETAFVFLLAALAIEQPFIGRGQSTENVSNLSRVSGQFVSAWLSWSCFHGSVIRSVFLLSSP